MLFLRWCRPLIFLLAWLVGLSGCASLGTYNPATGQREFIFIPTDQEVAMGQDIHTELKQQYQIVESGPQVERLRRIGRKLSQVSDRQDYEYHFYLINKDEMNAFTVPGGSVYFFSGLLDKLTSDDQVASVLAHEIGHCAARHTIKKFQAAVGYQVIGDIVLSAISSEEQVRRIATLSSNAAMSLIFSAYGRKDELQADQLGLKYMDLAGYDLDAMIQTFEVLEANSKGPDVPLILRSHPYIKDRIVAARQEIERIRKEDKT